MKDNSNKYIITKESKLRIAFSASEVISCILDLIVCIKIQNVIQYNTSLQTELLYLILIISEIFAVISIVATFIYENTITVDLHILNTTIRAAVPIAITTMLLVKLIELG